MFTSPSVEMAEVESFRSTEVRHSDSKTNEFH